MREPLLNVSEIAAARQDERRTDADSRQLQRVFGVRYFEPDAKAVVEAQDNNLYYYRAYLGEHEIAVERGDSLFWMEADRTCAHVAGGPCRIASTHLATLIRGYMPPKKTTSLQVSTTLPYVNGCSTRQIFPPERPGDPTLQLLDIPPFSAEQAHHIHSTVRVVYIMRGSGRSVVGMEGGTVVERLYPGKVCILEPMCPHHFETDDQHLICLPLHVFSSVASEFDHPMFRGTHIVRP